MKSVTHQSDYILHTLMTKHMLLPDTSVNRHQFVLLLFNLHMR